jgi:biopolymer transport protein ExbB
MDRPLTSGRAAARAAFGLALATLILAAATAGAAGEGGGLGDGTSGTAADTTNDAENLVDLAAQSVGWIGRQTLAWARRTPPAERITWGGLAACMALGLAVIVERCHRLRPGRVIPRDFVNRYLERLGEGKLDQGKALDLCEINPSPAARVALAAVRRWGRPVIDLERAVAMAQRIETDRLRRNVGTLRRIAALAPLLGLLGALVSAGRVLSGLGAAAVTPAVGPALATALTPLTAGVALAILSLVAYDGLTGRVEKLSGALDRVGAETVDAIALMTPAESRTGELRTHLAGPARPPHAVRVEIPDALTRARNRDVRG